MLAVCVCAQGHVCAASPNFNHTLPQVFSKPLQYDPERFAPPREEDKAKPFSFIGFGGGRHACIGSNFAYLQVRALPGMGAGSLSQPCKRTALLVERSVGVQAQAWLIVMFAVGLGAKGGQVGSQLRGKRGVVVQVQAWLNRDVCVGLWWWPWLWRRADQDYLDGAAAKIRL